MMDIRQELQKLPEPEMVAVDRVWRRFEDRHAKSRRVGWVVGFAVMAAVAAGAVVANLPETSRSLSLASAGEPSTHAWSDQVHIEALGVGELSGTSKDVRLAWESGTVRVEVEPDAGNTFAVDTEEAEIEVVGTVFSVRRDPLGVTVDVERGKVKVQCRDGWSGQLVTAQSRTCLPVTPGRLLGRADALTDAGAPASDRLDALSSGLAVAQDETPIRGELLVRRMRLYGDLGQIDAALSDADVYLGGQEARTEEVLRFAGWLALAERGCQAAIPYLERASTAEETVLLAECLAPTDPLQARRLLTGALTQPLDDSWTDRVRGDLEALR